MGSSNPGNLDGGQASPSGQNEWFGYHFEQILGQATQVVKMCDSGAILNHFWSRPLEDSGAILLILGQAAQVVKID